MGRVFLNLIVIIPIAEVQVTEYSVNVATKLECHSVNVATLSEYSVNVAT